MRLCLMSRWPGFAVGVVWMVASFCSVQAMAQIVDFTRAPNPINEGIKKSLVDQIGPGRGDFFSPDSSLYVIRRDPFRAIRRGRQLFHRKFSKSQGLGPIQGDGAGNIALATGIGAGLADSCAACHGRPRGGPGVGVGVVTRPDGRDAPHLYGIGLIEMLADEMTTDLRLVRDQAVATALSTGTAQSRQLTTKGINFGTLQVSSTGVVDTSQVQGVSTDLRIRPFFAQGTLFSLRSFVVGALNAEMGLQAQDPDTDMAAAGGRVVTPAGFVFDGSKDNFGRAPASSPTDDRDGDGVANEFPTALVDYMELYMLNAFRPGTYKRGTQYTAGLSKFNSVGCSACHVQNLLVNKDRRVIDFTTGLDRDRGIFNGLFATASMRFTAVSEEGGVWKRPNESFFIVEDVFTDLKRHDLGPNFWERTYNGGIQKLFVTEPLWGVGSTAPYGHDGRSINLLEVILRHGGEATASRNAFAALSEADQNLIVNFLNTLVLYPPEDTASTLDLGNRSDPLFPQVGHGSMDLTPLFNDPTSLE